MRILLGADFHLGARFPRLGEAAEARRGDLLGAFERFIDHALDPAQRIDLVLCAGDLFDHHTPPPRLFDAVRRGFERLVAAGRGVAALPGLHDGAGYPDSVYHSDRWPVGVTILKSPFVTRHELAAGGQRVHLYGMAWDPGRSPADPLQPLRRHSEAGDGLHIGLLHGSLSLGADGGVARSDVPIPPEALSRSDLDLIVVGHDHAFSEQRFGRSLVVVPGSLERLTAFGPVERHFTRIDCTARGLRVETSRYPARPVHRETIELTEAIDSHEALEEHLRCLGGSDRIVEIRLTGRVAYSYRRADLLLALESHFFHLEIEDSELMLDERWTQRLAGERTVRGLFVRRLRERMAQASAAERRALELALRYGLAELDAEEVADAA